MAQENEMERIDPPYPPSTPVSCEYFECNWKGALGDCETDMDSEGWEYPEYEVLVCPKCGEFSITF